MAGCYHDKQDFKSDLNIEVARECDILREDQELDEIECSKNPGHRGFIPFKDLSLEHLPIEDRNTEVFDGIKRKGYSVVRLVVDKLRNGRRRKVLGSGSVVKFDNEYFIQTNSHVVKTDDEVKHCTVEFHYDDFKDKKSDFTCRGVNLVKTCVYRDHTLFTFYPVPRFLRQLDWTYNRMPSIVIMYKNNQIETKESKPCKRYNTSHLQYFSPLNLNSSLISLMFMSWPDGPISYIKSFYFKFQPLPSNIQEITSIEIHIDEDDGNSRVIPGDVVTLGEEFVVKISESIFQDEVKKFRLVWNGEVIGRGTRLYFQQVKLSKFYNGIDLENKMKVYPGNVSIFECHPIPKCIEDLLVTEQSNNMCCIGHPHGGIKMVTFGQEMGRPLERFDNQYRRIIKPGPDCQCKEVRCITYSCKTCVGSSGSPVFPLYKPMDWRSCYTHFMGEKVVENKNINIAWNELSLSKI